MKAAPRDSALIHPEAKTDPTSSDVMDFVADELPPLIDASDSEDEDEAMDTYCQKYQIRNESCSHRLSSHPP